MPAPGFVPLGKCAEMGIAETGGGFRADFAAADGGIQFAVKGNKRLLQSEWECGNGSHQIARRVAALCVVLPLRTGQDDRFVQTLQGEGEHIGGIGECVRAVQHQNTVVLRQRGGNDVQPSAPVLQLDGGRINQRLTNVPIEIHAV